MILVLTTRGSIIGDSIREAALFSHLRKKYPKEKILANGSKLYTALLRDDPHIDKLIHSPELDGLARPGNRLGKLAKQIQALHKLRKEIRKAKKIVLTQNHRRIYGLIVRILGGKNIVHKDDLEITEYPEMYFSKKELASKKFKKDARRVIINIESKEAARCWEKSNYAQLIELLLDKKYRVTLCGTDEEYNQVIANQDLRINNQVGKLSIRETALLIKKSGWYIGNDSGLSHIAAAVGTNSISIMIHSTVTHLNNPKKCVAIQLRQPTPQQVVEAIK